MLELIWCKEHLLMKFFPWASSSGMLLPTSPPLLLPPHKFFKFLNYPLVKRYKEKAMFSHFVVE